MFFPLLFLTKAVPLPVETLNFTIFLSPPDDFFDLVKNLLSFVVLHLMINSQDIGLIDIPILIEDGDFQETILGNFLNVFMGGDDSSFLWF